jgi:hypothetical protein
LKLRLEYNLRHFEFGAHEKNMELENFSVDFSALGSYFCSLADAMASLFSVGFLL